MAVRQPEVTEMATNRMKRSSMDAASEWLTYRVCPTVSAEAYRFVARYRVLVVLIVVRILLLTVGQL